MISAAAQRRAEVARAIEQTEPSLRATAERELAELAEAAPTMPPAEYTVRRAAAYDALALGYPELSIAEIEQRLAEVPEPWGEPIALRDGGELPGYPIDALPGWLREWVRAEAHATQTPPDMAAMLALAAVATCCAGRLRVHVRDGWHEPLCVYTAIVLPPGTRKSAVYRNATAPLRAYERERGEQMAPAITAAQTERRIAEQRLRAAEQRAAKASAHDRLAAEQDARDAGEALRTAEAAVPVAPQLIASDATPEALTRVLAEQSGRIAVMDAEGCGPIAIMLGRYAQSGSVSVDVYLRGHAGDAIRVDRIGRAPITIDSPAVTLAITTQPEVLRELGERREVRGLGLLARILWCVPVSTVGSREVRPAPMPDHVRDAHASQIGALLDLPADMHTLRLSRAADDLLADLQGRIEPRLGVGGDLAHIGDWAAKLSGAVARVAGLLHAAEHPREPWAADIAPETMRAAITIGEYLLAHALAALGSIGADPMLADAEHILAWLRAHEVRAISRRDLYRAMRGRLARVADMDPVLGLLADRGWVRVRETTAGGAAQRTTLHILVTPRAMDTRDTRDTRACPTARSPSSVPSVPSVHGSAPPSSAEVGEL